MCPYHLKFKCIKVQCGYFTLSLKLAYHEPVMDMMNTAQLSNSVKPVSRFEFFQEEGSTLLFLNYQKAMLWTYFEISSYDTVHDERIKPDP